MAGNSKLSGSKPVNLPYEDPEFDGVIKVSAQESKPCWPLPPQVPEDAPNVIVIMTDDVGFGAASTFGGPAQTPSMSKIAEEGLMYNRFHTTAMCSPTRAALLTGRHPHNVSTGIVCDDGTGYPGYCGVIPKSCATIGQILKMNGYNTGWFGKNHNIPYSQMSSSGPYDYWPTSLGFEHFYGFNGGDSDQYFPNLYADTVPIQPYEGNPDYHLDTDLADKAIQFIKERQTLTPKKPFFLYYVPGATHAPHQVPEEYIKRYTGKFDHGWDEVRLETLKRQIDMGICPKNTKLSDRPNNIPAWDDHKEEEKEIFSRMMEVYCGFLEFTDYNIGRVLDYVEEIGIKENTLVIYIQGDNGGSAEGSLRGTTNEAATLGNNLYENMEEPWSQLVLAKDDLGSPLHCNHMPVGWAWALNSPMQWAKRYASHFGGTRNGMVMRWPKVIKERGMRSQFHHVIDILPTIIEATKIPHPIGKVNGIKQSPIDGVSMVYTWSSTNEDEERRPAMIFEMAGNRGLYKKPWMLSSTPQVFSWVTMKPEVITEQSFEWELYNIEEDFSQGNNLLVTDPSPKHSAVKKRLYDEWMKLAAKNNIFPLSFNYIDTEVGKEGEPLITSGYGRFEYPNGITRIPESCCPDCKNISFTIEAHLKVPFGLGRGGLEGVIFSMGGRFAGFGLVAFEDKLTWVYKCSQWPDTTYTIESPSRLGKGAHVVTIKFDYEGGDNIGGPGTFRMFVDKNEVGRVHAHKTVQSFFSLTETLDIGSDTGTPLLDDYHDMMPFKFTGEIDKVVFDCRGDNLSEETKTKLGKARRKFLMDTE